MFQDVEVPQLLYTAAPSIMVFGGGFVMLLVHDPILTGFAAFAVLHGIRTYAKRVTKLP